MSGTKNTTNAATMPDVAEQEFLKQLNEANSSRAQQEELQAKKEEDAERVRREARRTKKRRKATREHITRLLAGVAVWVGSYLASTFGLCHVMLALAISAGALSWMAFWSGAWIQYMWPKGGLFDGD